MGEYAKYGFDQQGWYGMFVACGIWCLADVSSVSPSSEQTPVTWFWSGYVTCARAPATKNENAHAQTKTKCVCADQTKIRCACTEQKWIRTGKLVLKKLFFCVGDYPLRCRIWVWSTLRLIWCVFHHIPQYRRQAKNIYQVSRLLIKPIKRDTLWQNNMRCACAE